MVVVRVGYNRVHRALFKVMREKIDAKSEAQGFDESRLPTFSEEDSAMILGSSDFLGMNFYTAQVTFEGGALW